MDLCGEVTSLVYRFKEMAVNEPQPGGYFEALTGLNSASISGFTIVTSIGPL